VVRLRKSIWSLATTVSKLTQIHVISDYFIK